MNACCHSAESEQPSHEYKSSPPRVLILFGGNAVSYNAASALQNSGYEPICLMPANVPKWLLRSNRYAVAKISAHKWQDEGYLDDLLSFLKSHCQSGRTLTFLTNDPSAYFWIRNRSRLEEFCFLPTSDITPCYDKRLFFEVLRGLDLDHADTWAFTQREGRSFPYLVKPAYKDESNRFVKTTGAKVLLAHGPEDLRVLNDCDADNLICQCILDYDNGQEYDWWGYRNCKGEIVSVTAREISKFPDKRGRVTHVELVDEPELKAIGDKIVTELDYRGIADIQFIRDRATGRFFVIEMNPRLWCSHELLLMSGINLIRLCADDYYQHLDTDDWPPGYLDGLEGPHLASWYSVLYNISNFKIGRWRCTEHYELRSDNFVTRWAVRLYYLSKIAYYSATRRV